MGPEGIWQRGTDNHDEERYMIPLPNEVLKFGMNASEIIHNRWLPTLI